MNFFVIELNTEQERKYLGYDKYLSLTHRKFRSRIPSDMRKTKKLKYKLTLVPFEKPCKHVKTRENKNFGDRILELRVLLTYEEDCDSCVYRGKDHIQTEFYGE